MSVAEPIAVTMACACGRCGARFTVRTAIGPSRICGGCADGLRDIIWDGRWPAMKAHLAGLGKLVTPEVPAGQNRQRRHHRRAA